MKTKKPLISSVLLCLLLLVILSPCSYSQQFLTKVAGWNAYVHLPDDYSATTQNYPAIIFFPGTGEVGYDASRLLAYGPSHFIAAGSNMNSFLVNGQAIKPIIISLQPTDLYPQPWLLNTMFDSVLVRWRIDPAHLNVTGLSMGGFCPDNYVSQSAAYASRINSVVAMSAVIPNNPLTNFSYFALSKGKWWGFEGTQDYRCLAQIRDTMNKYAAGSARYTSYAGGHCCWNTWYDPAYTESVNGQNMNIYQWMLAQNKTTSPNQPPTVTVGSVPAITLPANSVILSGTVAANGGASITSVTWTETGGGTAVITSPSSVSTAVTGLAAGSYAFQLSATDNHGMSSTSTATLTVNTGTNIAPTVDAGSMQTITLPADSVILNGKATANNGASISSTSWTELSGPTSTLIKAPSSLGTSVAGLAAGVYLFQLKANDNNGLSSSSTVTITVTTANPNPPSTKLLQVNLYGGTNPYQNIAWNNWNVAAASAGAVTSSLFGYSDGTLSPITATLSYGQGVADNGSGYGGIIVSPEVLRYASYNSSMRTLTINNIPADTVYTIEIYGSRANVGNSTIYTINNTSKTLVSDYNLSNSAVFNNIAIKNGQLVINMDKKGSFNYINGFKLSVPGSPVVTSGQTVYGSAFSAKLNADQAKTFPEKLEIYPNPVKDMVNICWTSNFMGKALIMVSDAGGRTIRTITIDKTQQVYTNGLDINYIASGIYYLMIKMPEGKIITRKIIKE